MSGFVAAVAVAAGLWLAWWAFRPTPIERATTVMIRITADVSRLRQALTELSAELQAAAAESAKAIAEELEGRP